jgi:hypothetical protein
VTSSRKRNKHSRNLARFNPGQITGLLDENSYRRGRKAGAHDQRKERVVRLRRGKGQRAKALTDQLDGCRPKHRCLSPTCPECGAAANAASLKAIRSFLDNHHHHHGEQIVVVSVVPADGEIAPGELNAAQHARNIRRWKQALGRAGATWFIGATDWSYNTHVEHRYKSRWIEHFHGFTATHDVKDLKRKLRKQFPATDAIPRPVHVKQWDGNDDAIRYALKATFWRRIASDNGQRYSKHGKRRKCRATDKQPLTRKQERQLLLHLDQLGLQGRFVLRWAQFTALNREWTLVDRKPRSHR